MTPNIPTATYRVQLRDGLDFAGLQARLGYIAGLGISHLYLSPIFSAVTGSTHGYDIIDPSRIDPVLGGMQGFRDLAKAATDQGLGIILDIVPNHTAFSTENPWLDDVLRRGPSSRYAPHFDIDWQAGPLVLPFLPEPFEKLLSDGAFTVSDGMWRMGDLAIPLAENTADGDLRDIHQAQHWRLVHSDLDRDGITHRRFFNVTGLIGMRVEDPRVFDDTHSLIIELVRDGMVQGLRVDHIDGLVDPAGYLTRLAQELPDTPIWVEKILVGDERLPDAWPTAGTTGYEAAELITRMLTHADGLSRLDTIWCQTTGNDLGFAKALSQAKADVLDNELAAERRQLSRLAADACAGSTIAQPGPESLREAVTALLIALPRYRTYVYDGQTSKDDRALIARVADDAAQGLRSDTVVRMLQTIMTDPKSEAQHAFVTRFQQVSGALLAKSQEDTAGFRWTRYLAANEVGAEPDEATVTSAEATGILSARKPADMVLTSTHDTKRSEDARMRLAAISHLPEDFRSLLHDAQSLPCAKHLAPDWQWYLLQSALAIHGADDAGNRLANHMEKAMREAKLTSFWTNPDQDAEAAAARMGHAVLDQWRDNPQPALLRLLQRGQALSLAQLLFKALMPGFPDFYRGSEDCFLALTDPDNRRAVDWAHLAALPDQSGFGAIKARWTRNLLTLRRDHAPFLADAPTQAHVEGDCIRILRGNMDHGMMAQLCMDRSETAEGHNLLSFQSDDGCTVTLTAFQPSPAPTNI
ncbi:malto-oligosyltrehalose synthase [Paracoccus sp. JM45]|uniref:malto-oligosyltrehalose synthase n=1 Tax=Paracoccus sp. JM45 TaxID=2283626 RepID=UPI000E6D04CE|nr:malto-oligosyltrehalose synthase [Paracoccus sp. JM45]RJE81119.1 malto-oligosyltrehalose synthase [Paracoccus sp. JM45]